MLENITQYLSQITHDGKHDTIFETNYRCWKTENNLLLLLLKKIGNARPGDGG